VGRTAPCRALFACAAASALAAGGLLACSTTINNYYGADGGGPAQEGGDGLGVLPDGTRVTCSQYLDDAGAPLAAYPFGICCDGVPHNEPCPGNPPAKATSCVTCDSTTGAEFEAGAGPLCKYGSTCSYRPSAGTDAGWVRFNPNLEGTCYQACVAGGFGNCSCEGIHGYCFCYP
jgi:hypothetical protein